MDKFCTNCGAPITGNFCSNCGKAAQPNPDPAAEYVGTTYIEPTYDNYNTFPRMNVNKNKGCLKFFGFFFLILIVTLTIGTIYAIKNEDILYKVQKVQNVLNTEEDIGSDLLEFDKKSWEDFKLLYTSHNNFMKTIAAFSDNKIDTLDFYNACNDAEKYFSKFYNSLGYGTDQDERDYLGSFETVALNDQRAAKYFMLYIDSEKTSDLSKAQENITVAKDALVTIAKNRGLLLVKAGLTDKEIKKKVEKDMAELESTE